MFPLTQLLEIQTYVLMTLTKIILEDEGREDINDDRHNLGQDHQEVPCSYLECHYKYLCEYEGCERDGHNVDELRLEEKKSHQHDHTTCVCMYVGCGVWGSGCW